MLRLSVKVFLQSEFAYFRENYNNAALALWFMVACFGNNFRLRRCAKHKMQPVVTDVV